MTVIVGIDLTIDSIIYYLIDIFLMLLFNFIRYFPFCSVVGVFTYQTSNPFGFKDNKITYFNLYSSIRRKAQIGYSARGILYSISIQIHPSFSIQNSNTKTKNIYDGIKNVDDLLCALKYHRQYGMLMFP